jgi:hypothetical protein
MFGEPMLRRIRSALVIGLLWGIAWLILGIVVDELMVWFASPPRAIDTLLLGIWTGLGIVSGTTFAGLLARLERNRTVETLAFRRLVLWGVLAGAGIPILFAIIVLALAAPDLHLARSDFVVFTLLGAIGAATAAGTIAIARRGEPVEHRVPPA